MFENFSFSSPSSTRPPRLAFDGDDRLMVDSDSALISPLSSRCPSPRSTTSQRFPRSLRSSHFRSPQPPPTSVPFAAYDHKRLSISTLTKKLHEHTIHQNNPSQSQHHSHQLDSPLSPSPTSSPSAAQFPGYVLTPPDTDLDDEGFFDDSSLTSPSLSPQSQSPFLNPTSVPTSDYQHPTIPEEDLESSPSPTQDGWTVRTQRQHISRLQCNPSDIDAIRRSLLTEDSSPITNNAPCDEDDYHPSSLPPQQSPRRRAVTLQRTRFRPQTASSSEASEPRGRRKSSCGAILSHRIEKNYHSSVAGRDRKKSEQGLRRKSLVSAALASMVERE